MSSGSSYADFSLRLSESLSGFITRHRVLVLLVNLVITAVLGFFALQQQLSPGFDKSLPLSHPYMELYQEYLPSFGGANSIKVFVEDESGDMFNPRFFKALEEVTNTILVEDGVDPSSVTSLFTPNVNYVQVNEEGFTGSRIVPANFTGSDEDIAAVRGNIFKSEEIGKTVASDLSGAMVLAELVERDPSTGEKIDYYEFAQRLEALRAANEKDGIKVRIIGFAKFTGDVIDGASSVISFFGIALAITFLLLVYFSRSLIIATAGISVALVAVIWELGAVKYLGYGVDPLSILVPFLILSIGVSHAVQMTNTWKLAVVDGASSIEASRISFNKLFIPGATALLSDAVGFAVIMLIDIEIIRELGITASIGIAVMLITNKFLLPVLLSYIKLTPAQIEKARQHAEGADHPIWHWVASFSKPVPATIILLVSAGIFGAGFMKAQQIIIGDAEAGAPELWPDARYNRDIDSITQKFDVGLDEFTVLAVANKASACTDYSIMETIDEMVWHLRNTPGVLSVKSLTGVVRYRNIGNNEGHPKFYEIPRSTQMISANMYRIEASQRLFNEECSVIPLVIYTEDHKAETLNTVIAALEEFKANNSNPDVSFELAMGNAGVAAATNQAVAASEKRMALILFAAVGLFCFLSFLSWRAAVCIVVPLAMVSYLGNAVMVYLDIGLKVSTLPVLALGVGVGVDYGIYLYARMHAYLGEGKNLYESYYEALKQSGTAIIFTATTMSIGVITWAFSALKFQADMGILLAYMFFVNMVGAIVLIPALARFFIGDNRKIRSTITAH